MSVRRAAEGEKAFGEVRPHFPFHLPGQGALSGIRERPIVADDHRQGWSSSTPEGSRSSCRPEHVIAVHLDGNFHHSDMLVLPPEEIGQKGLLDTFEHAL